MLRIYTLLKDFYIKNKRIIIIVLVVILISIGLIINNINCNNKNNEIKSDNKKEDVTYSVLIKGEVKKEGKFLCYKKYYLYELINMAGGLTEYAYIDDINLIEIINFSCIIDIKKSDIKNNNDINIIEVDNINSYLVYFGRIKGLINIYKVNKGKTIDNLKWFDNDIDINEEGIIESDTCFLKNTIKHKLNINMASNSEIENINVINDDVKEAIIEYRNNKGYIKSFDELSSITIITTKILNTIKANFSIE